MSDSHGVLRQISWRDLCPWLVIFRAFGLSVSLTMLGLGTVGALLTPLGWKAARAAFLNEDTLRSDLPLHALSDRLARLPLESPQTWPRLWPPNAMAASVPNASIVFREFVEPYLHFFSLQRMTVGKVAFLVAGALWTLLIWSVVGGAMTRIAVVQFGREEVVGVDTAIRFALRRLKSYFIAPLFPLGGAAVLCIPALLAGLVIRWDFGVLLVGIAWFVLLLAGLGTAVLLLGALFGWPLMWCAVSTEEEGDEFEALHRSYSYTFQRPLHYLFYAALAVVLGILGSVIVVAFAESAIHLTDWAVSWTSGNERIQKIGMQSLPVVAGEQATSDSDASNVFHWGVAAIHWWRGLVRSIAAGFQFSFFWCAFASIYLLLRRDVDHTEFDEVFLEQDQRQYTLPRLQPLGASATPTQSKEAGEAAPANASTREEPPAGDIEPA